MFPWAVASPAGKANLETSHSVFVPSQLKPRALACAHGAQLGAARTLRACGRDRPWEKGWAPRPTTGSPATPSPYPRAEFKEHQRASLQPPGTPLPVLTGLELRQHVLVIWVELVPESPAAVALLLQDMADQESYQPHDEEDEDEEEDHGQAVLGVGLPIIAAALVGHADLGEGGRQLGDPQQAPCASSSSSSSSSLCTLRCRQALLG